MATKYYDPNDPDTSRQALLDQLGPQDPSQPPAGSPPQDPATQEPTLSAQSTAQPRIQLPTSDPPPPAAPPTSTTLPVPSPPPSGGTPPPTSDSLPVPGPGNAPRPLVPPAPAPTTPTAPTYGGNPNDPAWIQSFLSYYASQPGMDPSLASNPAYWQRRMLETGGLSPSNTQYWIGRFKGQGGDVGGPAPAPTPPPFSGDNATKFGIPIDPATAEFNQKMRDFMTKQLGDLSQPTTEDSPDIAPALSAYNNQSQRGQEQNDAALAEAFYANGNLGSGAFRTTQQAGREATAGTRAQFAGQTILTASQQKRQQLQEMLQTATTMGMTQQAQEIQKQIALIDAGLRDKGLNLQNSQFGDQLGFNYANLIAQMNRDSLLNGLNG